MLPYKSTSYTEFGGQIEFRKKTQSIGTNIQKISQNVSSMGKMVDMLGTPQDNHDLRHQLQKIQQYTHQLVKDTSTYLKDLKKEQLPTDEYEQRQCKMQRERLTEEFTAALNMFQNIQRKALAKENQQVKATRAAATTGVILPPVTDPFREDMHPNQLIELRNTVENSKQGDMQLQQQRMNLKELQDQEKTIRNLERDINDVNEIYKELGKLVHDQGEVIDSIEAHMERTHVSVRQGANELSKASNHATRARKKRAILFASILIILLIIIGIVIWGN